MTSRPDSRGERGGFSVASSGDRSAAEGPFVNDSVLGRGCCCKAAGSQSSRHAAPGIPAQERFCRTALVAAVAKWVVSPGDTCSEAVLDVENRASRSFWWALRSARSRWRGVFEDPGQDPLLFCLSRGAASAGRDCSPQTMILNLRTSLEVPKLVCLCVGRG